jgi:hypothetical protein
VRLNSALVIVACALGVACAAPAPQPTPVPTVIPTAAPSPVPTTSPTSDVENAFLSNVDDLIAEVTDIAVTPCDELVPVVSQNPGLLPSVRGFAATLKRASSTQDVLNTDAVKSSIADLDQSMGQLDGALSQCGIASTSQP